MKASELKVGGIYFAKVSNIVQRVRLDAIRERITAPYNQRRVATAYDVTNLATGRKTTFRSAAKFRGPVVARPLPTRGLCPICGEQITLTDRRAKDGRLVGSCGDAFLVAQWMSHPLPVEEDKRTAEARMFREQIERGQSCR